MRLIKQETNYTLRIYSNKQQKHYSLPHGFSEEDSMALAREMKEYAKTHTHEEIKEKFKHVARRNPARCTNTFTTVGSVTEWILKNTHIMEIRDTTARRYVHELNRLVSMVEKTAIPADIPLSLIDEHTAFKYLEIRNQELIGLSPVKLNSAKRTIASCLRVAQSALHRCIRNRCEKALADQLTRFTLVKSYRKLGTSTLKTIDEAKLMKLFDTLHSFPIEERKVVYLGLFGGLRAGEILHAEPDWLEIGEDSAYVRVCATETFEPKGHYGRAPINREVAIWLKEFSGKKTILRLPLAIERANERLRRLDIIATNDKPIHGLRMLCGCFHANKTNIFQAQLALRHKSAVTTLQHYAVSLLSKKAVDLWSNPPLLYDMHPDEYREDFKTYRLKELPN